MEEPEVTVKVDLSAKYRDILVAMTTTSNKVRARSLANKWTSVLPACCRGLKRLDSF